MSEATTAIEEANPADVELVDDLVGKYCIARGYYSGVWAGVIESVSGQEVVMQDARNIWYWEGAAALSGLAKYGTSKPESCKFPAVVSRVKLKDVSQLIECTEESRESIESVPEWKA